MMVLSLFRDEPTRVDAIYPSVGSRTLEEVTVFEKSWRPRNCAAPFNVFSERSHPMASSCTKDLQLGPALAWRGAENRINFTCQDPPVCDGHFPPFPHPFDLPQPPHSTTQLSPSSKALLAVSARAIEP